MNKVVLMGRLTRDPELKEGNGKSYLRFNLAVDRRFKKEGQPTADFPSCLAFGKDAENIAKYFQKGSMICLGGRIQTGSYTNKDGQKVYTTEVVVEEWSFTGSKGDSDAASAAQAPAPSGDGDLGFGAGGGFDEDLPFN